MSKHHTQENTISAVRKIDSPNSFIHIMFGGFTRVPELSPSSAI